MPRFNVKRPDGMWCCFSTIVDDYVCEWMQKATYEEWRKEQYGVANYQPAEECNMMEYEVAESMRLTSGLREFDGKYD